MVMHVIQGADVRMALGVRHPRRATPRLSDDLAYWYCPRYHQRVASVDKIIADMRDNPKNVRYEDLNKVCEHYFGSPRTTGGSHAVFKTPCPATLA